MNILIVDDESGLRKGLSKLFQRYGWTAWEADSFDQALALGMEIDIHVALIDIRLGNRSGLEILEELKKIDSEIVCIMITGYGSIDSAVNAMRIGAADYLLKPIDNEKLLAAVKSQWELKNLHIRNDYLKSELLERVYGYEFKTANSKADQILKTADKVKNTEATVLITGESGTGKEILSRYIHFTSDRKDAQFVSINCAAISDSLLLSELFGHEKGAFTGAVERKQGKFELANNGTLFLDEIGDMSMETQSKLLRVLEDRSFERVGGTRRIQVNIRFIAATNKDLLALIKEKKFREDLYYRLKVISFHLPPLRERPEDIPLLTEHFISIYNKRYKKSISSVTDRSRKYLLSSLWPGNVRELQNLINQAVLLSDGTELELERKTEQQTNQDTELKVPTNTGTLAERLLPVVDFYEKQVIEQTLLFHKFNRTSAAEELGITRKTLSKKMEYHQL